MLDLEVGGAAAEHRADVVALGREEAEVEAPVHAQARAGAFAAEGLGDGGDAAEFASAVQIAPAGGGFTRIVGADGLDGPLCADHPDHLRGGNDVGHAPAVGGAHVHVLDEAGDDARVAEVFADADDFGLVHSALDDGVDLDAKAHVGRKPDVVEHFGGGKAHVVEALEDAFVERVEADRDAVEARVAQGLRLLVKDGGVRRERDVDVAAVGRPEPAQFCDKFLEALSEQGLAAREAQLLDAVGDHDARDAQDFLEGEELGVGEKGVGIAELLLGHAVAAAEVAVVGHRDAQVPQGASAGVGPVAYRASHGACLRNRKTAHGGGIRSDGNDLGHDGGPLWNVSAGVVSGKLNDYRGSVSAWTASDL